MTSLPKFILLCVLINNAQNAASQYFTIEKVPAKKWPAACKDQYDDIFILHLRLKDLSEDVAASVAEVISSAETVKALLPVIEPAANS